MALTATKSSREDPLPRARRPPAVCLCHVPPRSARRWAFGGVGAWRCERCRDEHGLMARDPGSIPFAQTPRSGTPTTGRFCPESSRELPLHHSTLPPALSRHLSPRPRWTHCWGCWLGHGAGRGALSPPHSSGCRRVICAASSVDHLKVIQKLMKGQTRFHFQTRRQQCIFLFIDRDSFFFLENKLRIRE